MTEWETTKVPTGILKQIQGLLGEQEKTNLGKYNSVADFVKQACILLLSKEGIKS